MNKVRRERNTGIENHSTMQLKCSGKKVCSLPSLLRPHLCGWRPLQLITFGYFQVVFSAFAVVCVIFLFYFKVNGFSHYSLFLLDLLSLNCVCVHVYIAVFVSFECGCSLKCFTDHGISIRKL